MIESCKSTSLYSQAITANNDGVSLIEQGKYEDARACFRTSLDSMRSAVLEGQHNRINEKCTSDEGEATVVFQWSCNAPLLNTGDRIVSSFVYRRALHIIQTHYGERTSGYPEESAAIIFNLALASHLLGLESNCSSYMEKAMQFYEIANAIRQRKLEENKLLGEQLLDAAILNNQGQLYHEFIEYGPARECFEQLSSRLVNLSRGGFLEQKDSEGFILNLMLEAPSVSAAA